MYKLIFQVFEVGIGLTIAIFIGGAFLNLFDLGIFEIFDGIFSYFVYLFGYDITQIFVIILSGVLLVMAGRWIFSWASNNGGQTPNNNGS